MRKFIAHRLGHENRLEQLWQQVDCFDQNQIVDGPVSATTSRMRLSETEPPQVAPLALQIIKAVGLEHVMRLQKTVEGVARTEAKQTAQLVLRKMTKLVFFTRQRFQRTPGEIATRGGEALGDIIGNLDYQVHAFSIPVRKHAGNNALQSYM
jgi:hypothetical protein